MLKIYRMGFKNAHFGDGYLNTSSGYFEASRLFSALCLEAIKNDCLDDLVREANQEDFVLSDGLPFTDEPWLPRPISYPEDKSLNFDTLVEDYAERRLLEELKAIPLSEFDHFIKGKANIWNLSEKYKKLFRVDIVTKKGSDPYEVGVTTYSSYIYVIAKESPLFDTLMTSLQYSGLGGKRSSGLGQFDLKILDLPDELDAGIEDKEARYQLLLTSSLPLDEEFNKSIASANYNLRKDSGFTYSETAGELLRKQDFYKFTSGSVFWKRYVGQIRDVCPNDYPHPVYNFAKGLFFGFKGGKDVRNYQV